MQRIVIRYIVDLPGLHHDPGDGSGVGCAEQNSDLASLVDHVINVQVVPVEYNIDMAETKQYLPS